MDNFEIIWKKIEGKYFMDECYLGEVNRQKVGLVRKVGMLYTKQYQGIFTMIDPVDFHNRFYKREVFYKLEDAKDFVSNWAKEVLKKKECA